MKMMIKPLTLVMAGLGLLAAQAPAQSFTVLHTFPTIPSYSLESDASGSVISGNTLYGTTWIGGCSGAGTVFSININGSNFTTLYTFTNGSDGANPVGSLVISGSTIYGTTESGGASGYGTIFRVNTNGSNFTTLHSLGGFGGILDGNSDNLVLSGDTLYLYGALNSGYGAVFSLNTNGSDFTTLYSFTNASDGEVPEGSLVVSGGTLYGMTYSGGSHYQSGNLGSPGYGTVFSLNTNGSNFTTLYSFSNGNDGANPAAGLILSESTLYGTTESGGNLGGGTLFSLSTDGHEFTTVYSFTTLNDGDFANAGGLILSGNNLYGTINAGAGEVYGVNTDGTGFKVLAIPDFSASFSNSYDIPIATYISLVPSGNTLYGTANTFPLAFGGPSADHGIVFSLSPPGPQLTITPSGPYVIITWPANTGGFTLQSTTNLVSPVIWNANSTVPAVIDGQNVVTNLLTGPQMFFRLQTN
jgi:uncharacterized repeat protein (TIGR03803 family)